MEMLALKHPLSNVLNALARSTEKQARGICAVLLVDADGKRLRCGAAPSLPPRWRKAIDGIAIGPHTGSCGAAAHSGQRVIAADIATDPAWADCRQLALPFGLRACTSVPIQSSKRELLGTFALFGRRPQPPTPAQLKLIDRAENLAAIILEHKRAEDALRESEERFRGLTELTGDRYWEQDAEFRFTWVTGRESDPNSEAESAMMIGKTRWETGVQLTSGTWEEHIRLLQAHKPYYDVELRRVDRSGREIFLVTSGEPVFDSEGRFKGYRGTGRDITARKRAEQLLRLEHTVARCVTDAESVSAALRAVIQAVCEAQDWDVGRYFRSDDQAGLLRFAESWNKPGTQFDLYIERSHSITYSPGVGIAGGVWQSGEPAWISDITRDPRASQKTIAAEAGMHGAFVFPVVSEGKTIGVLAFNSREIREPDERLLQAIRVIGAQIGQFVQRKRAEEVLRESEERFRSLIELSSDWYWEQDEHFRFTMVSDNLNEKMQRPGTVPLDKTRWDIPALNMTEQDWVAHRALLETRQPFRDLELHRRDRNGRLHIASVSGKPIFDAEGRFKGYRGVGQNITARRQAEEKIKNQALQQRLIAELGRQALASADLRDVLDRTMELVTVTLRADYCHVLELDPSRTHLVYAAVAGWPPEWVGKETVSIRPGSRNEHLLKRGEPIIVEDFEKDARFLPLPDSHRGMRSGIQVPLMGAQGAFGVLSAHALEPRRFHEDDVSFLQSVANILAVAIERKSAEDRLAYLAQFDSLTGLPNRYLFHDRLLQTTAQAKRSGHPMAMLFVDLDRFKLVNDTLGHSAGDKLLQEAAQRLTQCIRGGDTAGRFGGDEFGAIVTELARPGDAGLVAQKILDALAQPFQVNGQETYISASIGITLFPGDGDNPETLVMNADTAMYRAKEQGRNTYQFFTREMNERALRRVQTEAALRWAIERREFVLHYQPKINLKTGAICGFEALLRWQPPGRGLVLPVEFIPVLEETGLIVPVGEWVVRGVCEQVRTWRDAGLPVPPVTVNLSARQFQQKDLESSVRRMLHETGVDSALIQFELTESLLMQDPEAAARTLRGLKESGVKTSVDDFGTGYSSLAYLKRFPLDSLKIDRSFVRDITSDPEDAAIMLAIIALARSLKLKVVAEGVETREQLDLLVRSGCDEMQGYLFSPATTPEDCAAMLSEGRRLA
jgi:diguanylate cyclase (GGDEF)-like protein/PAS domain S-box-containing protein